MIPAVGRTERERERDGDRRRGLQLRTHSRNLIRRKMHSEYDSLKPFTRLFDDMSVSLSLHHPPSELSGPSMSVNDLEAKARLAEK